MKTSQQITDYIEAVNNAETGMTDEKMAARVAYVFLTPGQIFKVLLDLLVLKYTR